MVSFSESSVPSKQVPFDVLVVTDNKVEAESIAKALKDEGYGVKFSIYDGRTLKSIPVKAPAAVICVFSDYIESCPSIIKALKRHFLPKDIPFIGALVRHGDINLDVFDSVIFPPAHIKQIATRVSSMIRLSQMEREIERRIETLGKDFDVHHEILQSPQNIPFRVLFIGKATPEFMVVINALQKKNVEVIAAFTSFSAFDYLHDVSFNAVVMNALEQSEPALTISETMQRNSRLYHVPTLFLVNEEHFQDHALAYEKGARDIISASAETEEISGRILELANYHRIHDQLKSEFSMLGQDICIDLPSGNFNAKFFRAHMERVSRALKSKNEPLTLIAVKAIPSNDYVIDEGKLAEAFGTIGQMLKGLVRMQDVTARMSEDTFLIAFPEQGESAALVVAERISGIVDCAAFDSGADANSPFKITLESSIVTMQEDDDSESLIENALNKVNALNRYDDVPTSEPPLEAVSQAG